MIPVNPRNIIAVKNLLFGATRVTRNAIKRNFLYYAYKIAFDGVGLWSYSHDFSRNVASTHSESRKNIFLVLY